MKQAAGGIITLWLLAFAILLQSAGLSRAEGLSALARFDAAGSKLESTEGGISLSLKISQSVPWRVRMMDEPPRMILDTREVVWTGLDRIAKQKIEGITDLRAGIFRPGWSRLVIALDGPWQISRSEMKTGDQGAEIRLRLDRASAKIFAGLAAQPEPEEWVLPPASSAPPAKTLGERPLVVVLDAGHGGIDPGAERDGLKEADLVLTFALELKDLLLRDGRFKVVMTRDEDIFVPLENRISTAHRAKGHVFLSLHADALAEGEAQGATLYTLADEASDAAAAALAERHARDDLLAGIDLSAQDDVVATVLMDMARTQTQPRIERLAKSLEAAILEGDLRMHRKPRQEGGFSVLKSADIPSILLELGFMSSARDLKRLNDPEWRARMAEAIRKGLLAWSEEDLAIRKAGSN